MKLKTMLTAFALCTALTVWGGMKVVAEPISLIGNFTSFSDRASEQNTGLLSTVWNSMTLSDTKPFLETINLPKNTTFAPVDENGIVGVLTVTEKGISVPAFVLNYEFVPATGKDAMKDVFEASHLSPKLVSELYGYNVAILDMENKINRIFLEMVKRVNELPQTNPKIPFNMGSVDFLNVEQLHRAQDNPRIYTSSIRAVFFADGVALPVYGKVYVMKYGEKYRLFSLFTADSANKMMKEAADQIAAVSAK